MSGIFQFAVRTQTELEAKMTSVERIGYYIEHIEPEGEWVNTDYTPPIDWPARGRISFRDVKLKYRVNLPLALNGISFDIKPKEKVGIVGRTGSGKSSLGNALFRLYPLSLGTVAVDEIDASLVGLHELRKSMAAIPQDPSLFAGTVRFNLDPKQSYSDAQLWAALEKAYMKDLISSMDGKLDAQINEGGRNLSVGQRQLLCMARALLRNVRILLLDEATASLDAGTDKLIQLCLKEAFKDCTLLVIAHRLDSVVNSDKILIMDQGKMIEFDSPNTLLQNSKSRFAQILSYEQQQQLQRPNHTSEIPQILQQSSSSS
uniref:ABC transporter domain-containing protein n=1 Tax=Plectus sambesii TaxID=2011161 RepID=A0A914XGN0_9BILA